MNLAIDGGTPVRNNRLPYGRQDINDTDIEAVVRVLRSDWLTTGPMVGEFEAEITRITGAKYAVAVNSGTAALHAVMAAIGIGEDDEVIVAAMTFAASSNCVLYMGGTPVFVDVNPQTLVIDPAEVEKAITPRTRAIVAVDYAGQPADYAALRTLADRHNLILVADACHAIGGSFEGKPVGSIADLSTFSFHPVKHVTTGEGGAITTNNPEWAATMRYFRNHGITTDHHQREKSGSWYYEMQALGYNYRITDFQCALGKSQLQRLPDSVKRRQELAAMYDHFFATMPEVTVPEVDTRVSHAYHLYPVLLNLDQLRVDRRQVFEALRAEGIGVNVHYIPVYWHPYYQNLGYRKGLCPAAEDAYERLLSLPMFASMSNSDFEDVTAAMEKVIGAYRV
ncbi:MAG: UDP-4-amino-4,6-dideoxy-N-acetyl-beta-L-altrosamine transaminase [Anaerolineae bacterium]|nr:UDP-4-amino-4,6-dideoxy-N-acetyl-beta-L-altrosamine transaminase [Anaerolineae bacterium]